MGGCQFIGIEHIAKLSISGSSDHRVVACAHTECMLILNVFGLICGDLDANMQGIVVGRRNFWLFFLRFAGEYLLFAYIFSRPPANNYDQRYKDKPPIHARALEGCFLSHTIDCLSASPWCCSFTFSML